MDDFPFEDQFHADMSRLKAELQLAPGDLYEDCSFHPVVCFTVDYDLDEISGVSLIDGSYPRWCSLRGCGIRKLTVDEAWQIKLRGPDSEEDMARISADRRWWKA